jgi:hypothetical protein
MFAQDVDHAVEKHKSTFSTFEKGGAKLALLHLFHL